MKGIKSLSKLAINSLLKHLDYKSAIRIRNTNIFLPEDAAKLVEDYVKLSETANKIDCNKRHVDCAYTVIKSGGKSVFHPGETDLTFFKNVKNLLNQAGFRTTYCFLVIQNKSEEVRALDGEELTDDEIYGSACGDPYYCPECNPKIGTRRIKRVLGTLLFIGTICKFWEGKTKYNIYKEQFYNEERPTTFPVRFNGETLGYHRYGFDFSGILMPCSNKPPKVVITIKRR